ncbi:protein glycosylation K [Novosphingobium sediminis]|uniref:Protein glycosylation K n=1 Tax=Novosphingobium sediminis TaxID=707214 RepID=A0A512AI65_9SPHN|nr:ABC transporter ATP-binding protein [Novosphingobium sediminis]GEN99400.1 protein glycosylation K [Novosphingobium sediminis]
MRAKSLLSAVRSAFSLIDRPGRFDITLCIVGIAAFESAMLVVPWLFLKLLFTSGDAVAPLQQTGRIALVLGAILAVLIVRTIAVTSLWFRIGQRLGEAQRKRAGELFSAYLHVPYLELVSTSRSQMLEHLRQVSRAFVQETVLPVLLFLSESLVSVSIITVMLVIAPVPTILVSLWLILVFALLQRYVTRPSGELTVRRWMAFRAISELDEWSLQQTQSIQLRSEEPIVLARHAALVDEGATIAARFSLMTIVPRYVAELSLFSSVAVLFGWFAWYSDTSANVLRELAMFMLAGVRLLPTGNRTLSMIDAIQRSTPIMEAVVANLALHATMPRSPSRPIDGVRLFEREIVLQDIAFAYPDGRKVISSRTTLKLQRGEWLRIKGPSGGGKSTLVALLLGLLRPDEGHVLFDGEPADPATRLRGPKLAFVPQDNRFLRGTVAENITFPNLPSQLDRELALSLMRALGLDFELETDLGQDGGQLSGGQRQRLAIVKAMLSQPELLVLDEATAQLDPKSELTVFELIRRQLPETTVIIVAHKLGSRTHLDRVWEKHGQTWRDEVFPPQG